MFSQIGLSSISPSRRRSPVTSATPARIARRSPCGTGAPDGSTTRPAVGPPQPADQLEHGVVAGAGDAREADDLAARDRQVERLERARRRRRRAARAPPPRRPSTASATCARSAASAAVLARVAEHRVDDRRHGQLRARLARSSPRARRAAP